MYLTEISQLIEEAWANYKPHQKIQNITDISAKVSTNHVFKVDLSFRKFVIAKLSFFGTYDDFKEDHQIINTLANSLEAPYKNFLAKSLTQKDGKLYTYRTDKTGSDIWVVFYKPVRIKEKLPRRLEEKHIVRLGKELASFHKSCRSIAPQLPYSSKTIHSDIRRLLDYVETEKGQQEFGANTPLIKTHCKAFFQNTSEIGYNQFQKISVFVDWNIGNFSITKSGKFFSRWDYDWFRVGSRILDFYFFSRVVSDVGDRTVFSYVVDTLMEDRFIVFLKAYHSVYPLTEPEVLFIKEAYRFFILNYVIKEGRHFFLGQYADKLQKEAYELHLPTLDEKLSVDKIMRALGMGQSVGV